MLSQRGKSAVTSTPKGNTSTPMQEAKMDSIHAMLAKAMAVRDPACQWRSRIAEQRSHGFHKVTPHACCVEDVAKMPRVAQRVLPMGREMSCDRKGAFGVRA